MRSAGSRVLWVIVVADVLTALVAVVTNMATEVLPEASRPLLWIAWPVLALLVLNGLPLVVYLHRVDARARQAPVTCYGPTTKSTWPS